MTAMATLKCLNSLKKKLFTPALSKNIHVVISEMNFLFLVDEKASHP